jgi:putative transposase
MARQPRLRVPGVPLHVIQRGNNRASCFRHESDFLLYLAQLRHLSAGHECALHAYCLMPNHIHLLVTPTSAEACSSLMKQLGQRYAQYFNKRYGRTGTLWEGRFRSCVIDSARYLLACYRYIELNPVRAGIVTHPRLYPWSSYAANTGAAADPSLTAHAEFNALANDTRGRAVVYRALVEETLDPSLIEAIRVATNAGHAVGARARTDKADLRNLQGSDPDLF